jgi:predicted transcriptional regulator
MLMSTIETKYAIHQLVEEIDDQQFLEAVYVILERKAVPETDFWDELSETQKAAIRRGIDDATKGKLKPYQQVLSKYQ